LQFEKTGGGWGHINFDNVYQVNADGEEISWERVLAVESAGKLPNAAS
jgi:hypothetical protein